MLLLPTSKTRHAILERKQLSPLQLHLPHVRFVGPASKMPTTPNPPLVGGGACCRVPLVGGGACCRVQKGPVSSTCSREKMKVADYERQELGRWVLGYLEKGIQTPMAQGRSTKIVSMIKWIRTSRLSIKNSLSETQVPPSFLAIAQARAPEP